MLDLRRIKEKAEEHLVVTVLGIVTLLLGAIWKAVPSQVLEQVSDSIPKKALWAALVLTVLTISGETAYIVALRLKALRKTIAIVQGHQPSDYFWALETRNNKSVILISATVQVTNLIDKNVRLLGAITHKPEGRGHVSVEGFEGSRRLYGQFDIAPNETTYAEIEIWAKPPRKIKDKPLITSIAILDQFGNKHWTEPIEFSYGPR